MKESVFDSLVDMSWGKIWSEISSDCSYTAECDDGQGVLDIVCTFDGDLHLFVSPHPRMNIIGNPSFRARTYFGGGKQERVRRALILLALAIKEDTDPEIDETL